MPVFPYQLAIATIFTAPLIAVYLPVWRQNNTHRLQRS